MKHYYIALSLIGEKDIQLDKHDNITGAQKELRELVNNSQNFSIIIDWDR